MLKLHFNFRHFLTLLAIVSFFVGASLIFTSNSYAAYGVPRTINFQGRLVTNPGGVNVANGTVSIVFSLYNNASGGTPLWTETQSSVTVTDGIFRVALGSITAIPANFNFNWDGLYLGVNVASNGEMTPRIQMASVPFAFNAQQVAGLTVQDTSGNASTSGTLQVANGVTVKLPTSGTGLIYADAGTTGTLASLTNSTSQTGGVIGLAVTLSGANGSQAQTGLQFNLSGATSGTALDIQGTSNSWGITRAGAFAANNTYGNSGDCLKSGGGATSVMSWGSCGTGGGPSFWQELTGALSPTQLGDDLLLGGSTTASAKFAFTGLMGNQTQASMSGNLIVMPNKGYGGNVGIGATNPGAKLEVLSTTQQLKLSYDSNNYAGLTTGSNGMLNISTKGVNNLIIASDPNYAGYTNLYAGGIASPDSTNYGWEMKNDGSEIWFNVAPTGLQLISFGTANGTTLVVTSDKVGIGGGYAVPANTLSVTGTANFTGNVGIGDTTPASLLTVGNGDLFQVDSTGKIVAATGITSSGTITLSGLNGNNAVVYGTTSTGLLATAVTNTSGQCLLSGGSAGYAPSWGTCPSGGSGGSNWRYNLGAISPINDTVDLLIGNNASSSAKFGFINVNTGTPAIQISGTTVLTGSTLGSGVTGSSLTSVGILTGLVSTGTVTLGGATGTETLTLGQSSASQTINIAGTQVATGNTATIHIGDSATGTGKDIITMGNTNGASSLGLSAGSGGITLTNATTTVTKFASSTTNSDTIEIKPQSTGTGATINGIITSADLTTADKTWTFPNASGTVAVSASGVVGLDSAGNITCSTCVVSAGTLFTLAATTGSNSTIAQGGTVTLAAGTGITTTNNAAGQITIAGVNAAADGSTKGIAAFNSTNFSASTGVVNTIQNIATASTPQFAGLGIGAAYSSYPLDVISTAANQLRIGYNTSNYFTGAVSSAGAVIFSATGASAGFNFANALSLGTSGSVNGSLTLYSSGGATAPSISADSSKNLNITAPSGQVVLSGTGDITLDPSANNLIANLSSTGDFLIQKAGSTFATFSHLGQFSLAGAVTGKALAILNYTGTNQNILVASVSGAFKFGVDNNGYIGIGGYPPSSSYYINSNGFKVNSSGQVIADGGFVTTYGAVAAGYDIYTTNGNIAAEAGNMQANSFIFNYDSSNQILDCNGCMDGSLGPQVGFYEGSGGSYAVMDTGNGDFHISGTYYGNGSDVAEDISVVDQTIVAGDIVASSGDTQASKTTTAYQASLIGAISTKPGVHLGDSNKTNNRPLALSGRVPVKVTSINGAIKTGDAITSSTIPGAGMKAAQAGRVVGIALQDYDNADPTVVGTILVLINPTWYDPGLTLADGSSLNVQFAQIADATISGTLNVGEIIAGKIDGLDILDKRVTNLETQMASVLSAATGSAELATTSASLPPALTLTSLNVAGLATISGDLNVSGNSFIQGALNVLSNITTKNLLVSDFAYFINDVVFKGNVRFENTPTFNNDTAGFAVVKKGLDTVQINFNQEYVNTPIVTASIALDKVGDDVLQKQLEDAILNGNISYIITQRTTKGFVIRLNKSATADITFSWVALSISNPQTSGLDLDVTPQPAATQSAAFQSILDQLNSTPTPSP